MRESGEHRVQKIKVSNLTFVRVQVVLNEVVTTEQETNVAFWLQ